MMLDNQYHISLGYAHRLITRNPKIGAGRARLICIITDRSGLIIGSGWNQYKSHPLQARFADHPDKIYLHAEIDAIASVIRNHRGVNPAMVLAQSNMFIFRFNRDMTLGLAKPCLGCQRAIATFNIKNIIWSE